MGNVFRYIQQNLIWRKNPETMPIQPPLTLPMYLNANHCFDIHDVSLKRHCNQQRIIHGLQIIARQKRLDLPITMVLLSNTRNLEVYIRIRKNDLDHYLESCMGCLGNAIYVPLHKILPYLEDVFSKDFTNESRIKKIRLKINVTGLAYDKLVPFEKTIISCFGVIYNLGVPISEQLWWTKCATIQERQDQCLPYIRLINLIKNSNENPEIYRHRIWELIQLGLTCDMICIALDKFNSIGDIVIWLDYLVFNSRCVSVRCSFENRKSRKRYHVRLPPFWSSNDVDRFIRLAKITCDPLARTFSKICLKLKCDDNSGKVIPLC